MRIKPILGMCMLTLLSCATSCRPKEFNLSSSVSEIVIADGAETDSVVINGSDGTCAISHAPEWVETTVADSVVTIKTQPNTGKDNRADSIVVTCGASSIIIPINQGHKATRLEISEVKKLNFSKEGGTQEVKIDTDGSVKAEATDGIEASYIDGKLIVTVTPNTGDNPIKGTVKLVAGELTKELPVTIAGNICPTCKGTGKIVCRKCHGNGYLDAPGAMTMMGRFGCPSCGGAEYGAWIKYGKGKQTCPTCHGKGK